jgi:hypothetical protein
MKMVKPSMEEVISAHEESNAISAILTMIVTILLRVVIQIILEMSQLGRGNIIMG